MTGSTIMEREALCQLKGINDLVADAVDVGVTRTERIHRSIARYFYAVLARIGPVAAPVRERLDARAR